MEGPCLIFSDEMGLSGYSPKWTGGHQGILVQKARTFPGSPRPAAWTQGVRITSFVREQTEQGID
jgi:hypothetical protein